MDRKVRFLLIPVILLLVGSPSILCLNVSVAGPPRQPIRVKQKAHIRFLVEGVPVPAVQINLSATHSIVATLASGGDGDLVLPEVPPGVYSLNSPGRFAHSLEVCVVPCPDFGIETTVLVPTTLYGPLQVLDRDALAPSHIDMEIGVPRDPEWERFLSGADQQPSVVRVSALRGVIEDQSGAIIPDALVEVVAKGAVGKTRVVALLFADRIGRFSGYLADGDYLAIISAPGFRVRVTPFAVASTASATDLQFVLEVSSMTTTITLSQTIPF